MDQLPRLGKRELICLLSFTCNYVVFVWRGFLFLWVLGMGYVILLWHSLSLPYNYFSNETCYFENMQYFNIRYKILPTPFQYYSSNRLLKVVCYGGKIQCFNYFLCDILKHSLYLLPPGDCYCKEVLIHYASDHLSE